MCRPVKCRTCGKITWAGCGRHVAQVKSSVPAGQWCRGASTQRTLRGLVQQAARPLTASRLQASAEVACQVSEPRVE